VLMLFALAIGAESVSRLVDGNGHGVEATWWSFLVLAVVIGIDLSRLIASRRVARRHGSPALASNAIHFGSDLAGSLAVLAGTIFVAAGEPGADAVAAGGTLEVTTHFGVGKPLPAGWRLFFHLQGPAGYRNLDHVPVEGLMPLERWRTGQVIRDRQRIPIPPGSPPGTYTLYVGAYLGAQRLPVTPPSLSDGNNRLRLLSFSVTR